MKTHSFFLLIRVYERLYHDVNFIHPMSMFKVGDIGVEAK